MTDAILSFLRDYGLFFAKTATVALAAIAIVGRIAAIAGRGRGERSHLQVHRIDRRLRLAGRAIDARIDDKKAAKARAKADEAAERAIDRARARGERRRVFVLTFAGDLRASQAEALRHEVTAVLGAARPTDEVLVRLDSSGGVVPGYGLAAAQLERIRAAGIRLVIAVDKVAASGGYLMACIADHLVAAPFAAIGSIGVVAQLPNLHRLLDRHGVDFELLTAGKFKRTITVFGENTAEGRAQLQRDLDQTHALFQAVIGRYRPHLRLDEVADGRVWYGSDAVAIGLVDAVATSDDLLVAAARDADVIDVRWRSRPAWGDRLQAWFAATAAQIVDRTATRVGNRIADRVQRGTALDRAGG